MDTYGILGYGVVGKATHKSILWDKKIVIHDKSLDTNLSDFKSCKTVFVCLPSDTSSDVNRMIAEMQEVKKINQWCEFVVRSTVPIGTCNRIQNLLGQAIYYMPEFLRDRNWRSDSVTRPWIVGSDMRTMPTYLEGEKTILCSLEEAEICKMMSNAYASLRIVFANHFYDLAKNQEANYDTILQMLLATQHQDQNYLEANEELRGFGGKCLTKDLDFILDSFKGSGLSETLLTAIKTDNNKWPTTVRES